MDAQKLKEEMKKHIDILLEGFYEDSDLLRILPDVALQVNQPLNLRRIRLLKCNPIV